MAAIYLVRHGQASFGAVDYDQLSARGEQQAQLLTFFPIRAHTHAHDALLLLFINLLLSSKTLVPLIPVKPKCR